MASLTTALTRVIDHLPGQGKQAFSALTSDKLASRILLACMISLLASSLQPPVITLYTPSIQEGLRNPDGSSTPLIVATSYLVLAVITLVGGASGDLFGRKRFLLFGLAGLMLSNLLGMILLNNQSYVLANALNTITAALIMPMTIAIITLAFPLTIRPFAYGALFSMQGIGLMGASAVYSLAKAIHLEWLSFLPTLLFGVWAIRLVLRDVPHTQAARDISRREVILNVAWASAIFGLIFGLITLGGGINERTLMLSIAICLIGFVIAYRWVTRRAKKASPQLFHVSNLTLAILAGVVLSMSQSTLSYQLGVFFQKIQNVNPVLSSLRLVPFFLGIPVASLIIVRLAERFDMRQLIAGGLLLMALGMCAMLILKPDTPYWQIFIPLALMGLGFGIASPGRTTVVLGMPPEDLVGMAAGINTAAGQSGFALGAIASSMMITLVAKQHFMSQLQASAVSSAAIQSVTHALEDVFARVISGNLTGLPDNVLKMITVPFDASFTFGLAITFFALGLVSAASAIAVLVGMTKGMKAVNQAQVK